MAVRVEFGDQLGDLVEHGRVQLDRFGVTAFTSVVGEALQLISMNDVGAEKGVVERAV